MYDRLNNDSFLDADPFASLFDDEDPDETGPNKQFKEARRVANRQALVPESVGEEIQQKELKEGFKASGREEVKRAIAEATAENGTSPKPSGDEDDETLNSEEPPKSWPEISREARERVARLGIPEEIAREEL